MSEDVLDLRRSPTGRLVMKSVSVAAALAAVILGVWAATDGQVVIGLLNVILFGAFAVTGWYWADAALQIDDRTIRLCNLRRWTAVNLDQVVDCRPAAAGLVIVVGPRAQLIATVLETGWIPQLRPRRRALADATAARIMAEANSQRSDDQRRT